MYYDNAKNQTDSIPPSSPQPCSFCAVHRLIPLFSYSAIQCLYKGVNWGCGGCPRQKNQWSKSLSISTSVSTLSTRVVGRVWIKKSRKYKTRDKLNIIMEYEIPSMEPYCWECDGYNPHLVVYNGIYYQCRHCKCLVGIRGPGDFTKARKHCFKCPKTKNKYPCQCHYKKFV